MFLIKIFLYYISFDRLIILKADSKNKIHFLFYRPLDSAKMARNWLEYHKIKKVSPYCILCTLSRVTGSGNVKSMASPLVYFYMTRCT